MRMYFDVGTYGGLMVAMNALPPPPEFGGSGWAELWRTRLEHNEPYLLEWLRHPVDGPYWRGASLRPGYDRIACPVLLIGGWHDGYSNPMLRMFTKLRAPTRIIVGPWSHMRPNVSLPGPRIDYIAEMVRFFARHLRDDPAVPEGPLLAVYMQEFTTPFRTLDQIPGYWRSETTVAPEGSAGLELFLGPGSSLAPERADAGVDEYDYRPTVGIRNGYWSAGGIAYYLAADQREDEAYSVCYTTEPFERETHVFGWPRVFLYGSSSARVATFVAKLADVAPDGTSVLITDGSLNATRRDSLVDPAPLEPDVVYPLEIPMAPTGWVLAPGHRLRLAVSSSDFPNLWPTPEPARNRVHRGEGHPSRIVLPVVPAPTRSAPTFAPPPALESSVKTFPDPPMQRVVEDQVTGLVTVENRRAYTVVLDGNRGVLWNESRLRATASETDPAQASVAGSHRYRLEREDGIFEVVGDSSLRGTADTFHLVVALEVRRNGVLFFQRTWTASEPRKLL
jgi:predicted acyl esterase